MRETKAWLEMIQERSKKELETVNIESSFKEFCCNREKRNGTEAIERCGLVEELYF